MISRIQVIDLYEIPSLTKDIQESLQTIHNQPTLDSLLQTDNPLQQIPFTTIKGVFHDLSYNKSIISNLADLLFVSFRTIENLSDKIAHQRDASQKLQKQVQQLNRMNQQLMENELFLREQANQKIQSFQIIINQLQEQKKLIDEKYLQFQRKQTLRLEQLCLNEDKIQQFYENQFLKINTVNQQLLQANQSLKEQVQELKSHIDILKFNTQSTEEDENPFNLDLEGKNYAFTEKQVQDIQYEEELTSRSKIQTSQSLFYDMKNETHDFIENPQAKVDTLSTQQSLSTKKVKKPKLIQENGFHKTLYMSQIQRIQGMKKNISVSSYNFGTRKRVQNEESTLKKIHSFFHSNIVKKKIKTNKK